MWDVECRVCCSLCFEIDDRNQCSSVYCSTSAYGQSLPEGLRTLNNASVLNSVAFADDQTALIAPATALIPDNANFVASAYGVRSTCQSITSQCINTKDTGPDAYLGLNCASSTIFNFSLPTTGTAAPFGVLNSSGIVLDLNSYDVSSKCVSVTLFCFKMKLTILPPVPLSLLRS